MNKKAISKNTKYLLEYGELKGYSKEELLFCKRGIEESCGFKLFLAELALKELKAPFM